MTGLLVKGDCGKGRERLAGGSAERAVAALAIAVALGAAFPAASARAEPSLGKDAFVRSCAACHGPSGVGDGPLAHRLKPKPTDLTGLRKANGGVFPRDKVLALIDGSNRLDEDDGRSMPLWSDDAEAIAEDALAGKFDHAEHIPLERIEDIVDYIETLQR